jgi:hypothetical protein
VHAGDRLAQKHVVGESGSTGLSTGPHLHYGMKRGGHWVNPLNQNFPKADPLPATLMADFKEKTTDARAMLEAESVAAYGSR